MRSDWTWKVADERLSRQLHLRYEPGNWGDVLKGSWALLAAQVALAESGGRPFRYLDFFAGAPTYPLLEPSARRLSELAGGVFFESQAPFAQAGRLASTARLVLAAVKAQRSGVEFLLWDRHPEHRADWEAVPEARWMEIESGQSGLRAEARQGASEDLILVDPYDFFDHWGGLLASAAALAHRSPVLIYLYNKSPRGAGYADQYRRFRRRLNAAASGRTGGLLGRLPSDALEPRAFHEVALLGPRPRVEALRSELERETRSLARHVSGTDCFETLGEAP